MPPRLRSRAPRDAHVFMIIRIAALVLLLAALWLLFRFAMALRWSKVAREGSRSAEESRGRRVVAEIPLPEELLFFLEDDAGFYWGGSQARKPDVQGARMLLNGGVIGSFARPGAALPEPPPPEEYEGRERWDILIYCAGGRTEAVPCGSLREGVSREIAARIFEAVRRGAPSRGIIEG
jgi:hypothetical protein